MKLGKINWNYLVRGGYCLVGLVFLGGMMLLNGCAPLPPIEEQKPTGEVVKSQEPDIPQAVRDSVIMVRRSFGYERWKNGDYAAALEHLHIVRNFDIKHEQNIYRILADCYFKMQNPDSSLWAYEEGVKFFPQDDYLHSSLAILLRNKGNLPEAVKQQEAAVQIKPKEISYLQILKDLYIRAADYQKAIETLQQLKELAPDDAAISNELTELVRSHRDPEEYIAVLQAEVNKNPGDSGRLLQLANALFEQGRNQEAGERYEQYTKMHPEDAAGWKGLACCRDNLSQYEAAISAHRKAVDLDPGDLSAMITIGQDYLTLKNWINARTWAKKALALNGDYGPAWLLMGDIYSKAADAGAGETPKFNDKLVFAIAYGLYERAANSSDPQARSQGARAMQTLKGSELVPTKEDRFMNQGRKRPSGKAYEWIDLSWTEVSYLDDYLAKLGN